MFERYTEKARRVIFHARYEVSHLGGRCIETEHLLLGLLREDTALAARYLRSAEAPGEIRRQIGERTGVREKVSTSVDLPVSDESRRVFSYAAEEAQLLGHQTIATQHLLLGLLREEGCLAAGILQEHGLRLDIVRQDAAGRGPSDE